MGSDNLPVSMNVLVQKLDFNRVRHFKIAATQVARTGQRIGDRAGYCHTQHLHSGGRRDRDLKSLDSRIEVDTDNKWVTPTRESVRHTGGPGWGGRRSRGTRGGG